MSVALLLAAAGPASANTGLRWVAGLTPPTLGYLYIALVLLTEALALWRIGRLPPERALLWCGIANTFSTMFGFLGAWMAAMLSYVPASPSWAGVFHDPVLRVVGACALFFVVSALLEGEIYRETEPKVHVKERRRLFRAAVVGNAASNGIALILLLATPGAYQATTDWQWKVNNWVAAQAALKAYRADHGGRLPPATGPMSVNEALLPYMAKHRWAILRHGKMVNYDRPRWRRDWPELRMVVQWQAEGTPRWEVVAPDLERARPAP